MKKSKFYCIVAIVSIIFAANYALNGEIIPALIGITLCCCSLVIGAHYEREENDKKS